MAATISEVLAELTQIVEECRVRPSRLGYFAALYRRVTHRVAVGIQEGAFQDGPRMERLDVIFANRYLDAYRGFRAGSPGVCPCWQQVFNFEGSWRPLTLQHLLIGMNVHINYDLGIAAAQTMPGTDLARLRPDFMKINDLLAAEMPLVRSDLERISPGLRWLRRIGGENDTVVINFSMEIARNAAWGFAESIAHDPSDEAVLGPKRAEVQMLTSRVATPSGWLGWGLGGIRLFESSNVARNVAELRE